MSLLEQAAFALKESDRSISVVLDGLNLDLPSPHVNRCYDLIERQ